MVNTSALDGVEYHDEFFSISLNKSQISRERFGLIVFIFIYAMSDQVVYSVVCLQSRYPVMLYVWRDFKLYQFYLMLFVWLFWGSLFFGCFKSRSIRICSNQNVTIDIAMTIAANFKPLLDTYSLRAESKFMPHQLCLGTSVLQFYRQGRISYDKHGVLKTF